MSHKNIVKLHKMFEDQNYIYMIMDLCSNGSLESLITKRSRLSLLEARYYLKGLAEGLDYIHKSSVVHRDLKPANLVIDDNMKLKIVDFGLANYIRENRMRRTFCGTPFFIAPEIV